MKIGKAFRNSSSFALGLALIATGGAFAPAAAQETNEARNQRTSSSIVVTARRREERAIDVPIAITSVSGEALAERGTLDISDIANVAPNVTLEQSRATNSTLTAFIRGVGQQDPLAGFEQGVGIYLDDVYLNRPQAALLDVYDVERIEVLRGPQGTLYGRNTIGGAVKYVTKRLPQEFYLKARATYGTYNQADGVVSVGVPLNEEVRVGGSVARLSRDGFGDNLYLNIENGNKDMWAGRASIEAGGYGAPYFLRIQGDYTHDLSNPRGGHRESVGQYSGAPVLPDVFDTMSGLNLPKQDIEAYGVSLFGEVELSDALTVRSITAYRKDDSATSVDIDALPTVDVDLPTFYHNEQTSQELQLLYDNGGAFVALLGAYYLDANAQTQFDARIFATRDLSAALTDSYVATETYALFTDFTIDFTDQLSLSAGARYTWDKRSAVIFRQLYSGFGGSPVFYHLFADEPGVPVGAPGSDFTGEKTFNKFTPRVSLSFMPNPDHNIYGGYSMGFKGGSFDPRGVAANAPDLNGDGVIDNADETLFLSYQPEEVDSYEIGYKGSLLGGALNVAIAGFYAKYKNVQIPGSNPCLIGGVETFCGNVNNAGKATIKGVEFEGSARLGSGFSLTAAAGYIDAKFDEYITLIGGVPTDVADYRKFQNTPDFTASGSISYTTPVGDGDLFIGTSASYRTAAQQFEQANPFLDEKAYALVDGSIVYTAPGGRWSIGLFGKNLFDKEYKSSGFNGVLQDPLTGQIVYDDDTGLPIPSGNQEGNVTAYYGAPRQIFVTATFEY